MQTDGYLCLAVLHQCCRHAVLAVEGHAEMCAHLLSIEEYHIIVVDGTELQHQVAAHPFRRQLYRSPIPHQAVESTVAVFQLVFEESRHLNVTPAAVVGKILMI